MRHTRLLLVMAAVSVGVVSLVVPATRAQDPKRPLDRAAIMRQKLELSKQILEGLTLENLDTVAGSAKKLEVLGRVAGEWGDPSLPGTKQYQAYLTNFMKGARDLNKQARARELEGATFAYVQLTISCIECHKFVRDKDQPEAK